MQESDLSTALKRKIGTQLGDAQGDVCMRTRCQDILPKALSSECKDAGKGRAARRACKPYLEECQQDVEAQRDCAVRCGRYFEGKMLGTCVRDCNLKRCRVYEPYDGCVRKQTMRNVLRCFEETQWRQRAEECLRERCGVESTGGRLQVDE
eukprot:GFKZ01010421.1.p1 GENE.GFKZ01010421.1~~GFKZ01010421.1.p1  ORF type:complete len:151 (-),score=12.76 GFKZ01010421.1:937-1389(-)